MEENATRTIPFREREHGTGAGDPRTTRGNVEHGALADDRAFGRSHQHRLLDAAEH
jgi:hypothetical protein